MNSPLNSYQLVAMVLAGGSNEPLKILSKKRAKAAIPFGGFYRIIDFSLSNLMHAGIRRVGVLTQHRPESLMHHLGVGEPWDMVGRARGIKLMPPYQAQESSNWYKGSADAVGQNLNFVTDFNSEYVIILSGDHIYKMDYLKLLKFHKSNKADLTVVTKELPSVQGGIFGSLSFGKDFKIKRYLEKPENPISNFISLGIYIFNTKFLLKVFSKKGPDKKIDFGKDIIPWAIKKGHKVYAYNFKKTWWYIGDIYSYWRANIEILRENSSIKLEKWQIRTNLNDRNRGEAISPIIKNGIVKSSIIGDGAIIEGNVEGSIIFPRVRIKKGANIKNSIIMHDCEVGENTIIERAVIDKDVKILNNCKIGEGYIQSNFKNSPWQGITVIGRSAKIPDDIILLGGCQIFPNVDLSDFDIISYRRNKIINIL